MTGLCNDPIGMGELRQMPQSLTRLPFRGDVIAIGNDRGAIAATKRTIRQLFFPSAILKHPENELLLVTSYLLLSQYIDYDQLKYHSIT